MERVRAGLPLEQIPAKTIVTKTKGTGWFGTNYNMNLYRGCCHGCIYCDSRSECYGVEEFDRVRVKKNALQVIRDDLRRKVKPGVVATGAMSDPYNPYERDLQLTRHALELLSAYGFGVAIATKSELVLRDIDVLREIKEHSPVLVKITVTTVDDGLSRVIEPGAPASSRRLQAIRELSGAGVYAGVLLMPVLPFLEDTPGNILGVIEKAHEAGARFIYPAFGMTLRQNQRDWYFDRLDELFPGRDLRRRYVEQFGNSYRCVSPQAGELWKLFRTECDRRGILYRMPDIIASYQLGYEGNQLRFF